MKKLSLLSLMFLIFSFANAYGAEIKFKTNSSDQSAALTTSNFKNQVSAGAEFIASVNSVSKVYAGTSGLKFGTSSAAGDFTITLADAAQLKNPTITIASAKYKSESTSFEVYLNGATSSNATITAGATSNNSFTFSGIVTKIQIKSKGKRAYLSSITIEGEEGGSDLTPTSLAWSAETAIATIGADNTFPTLITTPTDLTGITYASSNTDIATIATDGTITLVASGVTTIMASFAGDDTHKVAADAKYTLTVVNPNAPEYQLFTGNLQAGEYVVYYNKVAMKAAVSSDRLGYETVNPIEDVIQTDNATIIWEIEQNGEYWTLYNTSAGKYAAGNGTKNQAALVSSVSDAALWTVTISNGKFEFVNKKNAEASVNKNLRYNEGYGFACYGTSTGGALSLYKKADDANAISSPTISGVDEFVESTEVTISAEEGLKVYYTLDGTDPTNASTEYTAPFELTATTTVKAVAYDGENASDIISKTFKQLQVLTCEEAAELCAATESADKYVVRGYVTELVDGGYNATYNNTTLWMADTKNGGQVLQAFRLIPVSDIEKTLVVGDYVEVIGSLVLWSDGTKEIKNGSIKKIVAPVVNHTITVSANPTEAGTVTGGGEFEETDEITVKATANEGYEFVNWTENEVEVSTDAEYTFEVLADRALVANFKEAEPEGIEVVLKNAYKEVYLIWNRANFFGEHATYGEISVQINNYNGYGTYAEGVSSCIDGVKVNGSATFENKGETDLLTATLTDAEGTVYIIKAEVPTPKTYEVVATNATYVNVDQGWTAELTVNGLTVGEEELTLTVYWDGVGGSEEGYEASAGFEGSLQGMILVDKGEDDVLSFEGTLKDASDNSYIFDFEATPKAAETYTLTFEEMVIEPGQWDDNLHITAENTEYAIEFQLFGGKTKGYGEYGFTDDYPDVDEIYINSEYATMAEGTVANYYLNEETGLATIELTVVLGIDIYNITLTGQPLVNPEDIEPTDTINIAMTKATIGLYMGMPKVAASSEEADLSIVLVGENPYKATVEDFSASSYLVTTAGSLTFLRGGLEIVEVGDVKIAYIGVLCSDHKWYNITLTTGTELPTALENLDTTVAPAKAIVNGQLVIIKNGVQYNAQGQVIK